MPLLDSTNRLLQAAVMGAITGAIAAAVLGTIFLIVPIEHMVREFDVSEDSRDAAANMVAWTGAVALLVVGMITGSICGVVLAIVRMKAETRRRQRDTASGAGEANSRPEKQAQGTLPLPPPWEGGGDRSKTCFLRLARSPAC
jgi:hypothetical protein